MAIQNKNNNYQELTRISLSVSGILLGVTAVAGGVLISQPTRADSSAETEVTVSVSAVCNMEAMSSSTAHTAEITPGTSFTGDIGTTNMKATCNDSGGYDIYAVGYSNNEWKNTNLINAANNNITIATCAQNDSTCNTNSYWSMKLSEGTGDIATIISPYNTYAAVPNDYTKVATRSSATTGSTNASFTTTYGAYAVTSQTAGNYDGKVKYTLVHPNGAPAPEAKDPTYYMQEIASWKDAKLPNIGDTVTAIDNRDNTEYLVGKLADGNIWMLDNLALDLTDSTVLAGLSTSNTNATDAALTSLRSGNRSAGDQYATAGVTNWTSGSSYSQPMVNMDSKNTTVKTYGNNNGKVGGYYNYCAASAGGYCYGNGTSQGTSTGDATTSICPAGWRMPTGGGYDDSTKTGAGEYFALGTALGLTFSEDFWGFEGTTYQTALGTPLSGYFRKGSANDQGDYGVWWSSIRDNNYSMFSLDADSDGVGPTYSDGRDLGYSMRCVAGS